MSCSLLGWPSLEVKWNNKGQKVKKKDWNVYHLNWIDWRFRQWARSPPSTSSLLFSFFTLGDLFLLFRGYRHANTSFSFVTLLIITIVDRLTIFKTFCSVCCRVELRRVRVGRSEKHIEIFTHDHFTRLSSSPPPSLYEILRIVESERKQRVHNIGTHRREKKERRKRANEQSTQSLESESKKQVTPFFFSVLTRLSSFALDTAHYLSHIHLDMVLWTVGIEE